MDLITGGPYTLKKYQPQLAFEHDFAAATTERPVVIHE
jgi:hypothetical protein